MVYLYPKCESNSKSMKKGKNLLVHYVEMATLHSIVTIDIAITNLMIVLDACYVIFLD